MSTFNCIALTKWALTLKLPMYVHLISFQSVDPVIGLPVMSSKGSFSVERLS